MGMSEENALLSDITVHMKYAKYKPEVRRREVWSEIIDRNKAMHIAKFPQLRLQIEQVYKYVYEYKVLPSMRSLQFGGRPIELANNRIYNCAFLPFDHIDSFSELMFLLLGGTGGGFSVQWHWISKLPVVRGCKTETRKFLVGDSIEGWADAIKVLVESHFLGKERVVFDLRDIREKGAELVTSGGKAPGPEPLRRCLLVLDELLRKYKGNKLSTVAAYDIGCHIADAVLAGGIRRAATICLFDRDDMGMMNAKAGNWYDANPQRARSNNSVVLERGKVTQDEFMKLMIQIEEAGTGDPGVYWTNDPTWGTNPCCEIGLRPYQFCNLVDINVSNLTTREDFINRCSAAAFIATLQASYTDFHYLRPIWKETAELEHLIGVGQTGIASWEIPDEWLQTGTEVIERMNISIAEAIGTTPSPRLTTVKPSGTSSLVLGCSSGIHAWHDEFYIRRLTVTENEAIFHYLMMAVPELLEKHKTDAKTWFITMPQQAPKGATTRHESMLDLLTRVQRYNVKWVRAGHRSGANSHNVSCTVSVKDSEWKQLRKWMWKHREDYNGIAVFPFYTGEAEQRPFEETTEAEVNRLRQYVKQLDLRYVIEDRDNTNLTGEIACSGDKGCEIL